MSDIQKNEQSSQDAGQSRIGSSGLLATIFGREVEPYNEGEAYGHKGTPWSVNGYYSLDTGGREIQLAVHAYGYTEEEAINEAKRLEREIIEELKTLVNSYS